MTDTTFTAPFVDTLNSSAVDYKSRPGYLQLETGERENLAKSRYAYIVYTGNMPADTSRRNALRLLDGIYSSPSFVELPPLNLGGLEGCYIIIDLQAFRTIKKVQMYTLGNNLNLRPRAYSIFAGEDTVTMEKVFQETDNTIAQPIAEFTPVVAKFVKIVFDVIAQNNSTVVSEIEVFGEGFLPTGVFLSSVRDFGKPVNFSTLEYTGIKPTGTDIFFSFRTGSVAAVDSTWSPWSDSIANSGSLFFVDEARRYLQYRVRLTTTTLLSPEIDELKINYDTVKVVSVSDARIDPQEAQVLKEQEFSLIIETQFSADDYGIDTIYVKVPSPVNLRNVLVNNVPAGYLARVSANDFTIVFNSTIKSNSTIRIVFTSTPFLAVNPYKIQVSSKLVSNNPQKIDSKMSNLIEAWSVLTVGVPEKLIINAKADPNPFTPNGDGRNDQTRIEFFLGNVGEPGNLIGKEFRKISIKIFDLNGRMVKDLLESETKAYAFISDNGVLWDGNDDNGRKVRPGVYLYQIHLDSDNGGETVTKTVVVAY
ncbi:MAG: gliding motility-associated C-terminal domain-containing protein [Ignavibacteriaceae bacterium]|nr:gliding motility-associated C-terminal domain-containing protein [Ignavibacteriaceae bacterium]